jgi:hypothetical protein
MSRSKFGKTIIQYLIGNTEFQTFSTLRLSTPSESASRIASYPIVSLAT